MSAEIPTADELSVQSRRHARIFNGLAALGAVTILTLAALLTPAKAGHGTHEQLGLPPCTILQLTGIPCPFCGMTTSFTHMAHFQPGQAAQAQPMGVVLFLITLVGAVFFVRRTVTGHPDAPDVILRMLPRWSIPVILGAFAAAWIYKIVVITT